MTRLIDADRLIYQSHAQHIQSYINKKDIDNAPTVEIAEDCISRETLVNELKCGYWNKELQSAKDDPCVIDAMIDWSIRTVKSQPSVAPKQSFINKPCISRGVCREDKINVLKKIRVEIIELRTRQNVGVLECLDIIDEYIAESEEKI